MPGRNAAFAHSLLLMRRCDAAIMFGIFPGINRPPLTRRLRRAPVNWRDESAGVISAEASVALSRTADRVLLQKSAIS